MRLRHALLASAGTLAALALWTGSASAQSALTGMVSSAEEGNMEGVVVTAKKDGSTIAVSVITDAQGKYAFPADRLEPGHYTIKARASGYEVDGAKAADVAAGSEAKSDIKLKKIAVKDLPRNLTNAEWLESMPGTKEQKQFLLNCSGCHTFERIMKSRYNADDFLQIFQRMSNYYPGSMPIKAQHLAGNATRDRDRGDARKYAEWLATVNLS